MKTRCVVGPDEVQIGNSPGQMRSEVVAVTKNRKDLDEAIMLQFIFCLTDYLFAWSLAARTGPLALLAQTSHFVQ